MKIYETLDIKLAKTAIVELSNIWRKCIVEKRVKYFSIKFSEIAKKEQQLFERYT